MRIIYSIQIRNGKCVTDYNGIGSDPVKIAKFLEKQGAEYLHITDLDGAFEGKYVNYDTLKAIRSAVSIPIQTGGGVRTLEEVERLFEIKINRLVLGTTAIKDQELLVKMIEEFGDKIIVAADTYDSIVYIKGWEEKSSVEIFDFIRTLELIGIKEIMYSDITRNNTDLGPNLEELNHLSNSTEIKLIAVGGIRSQDDLDALSDLDIEEAVIDKIIGL